LLGNQYKDAKMKRNCSFKDLTEHPTKHVTGRIFAFRFGSIMAH